MPLDFRFVDMIHTRLLVRYGAKWVAQTAPVTVVEGGEAMLKADWAEELDGIGGDAIRHALANLPPDFPPSASQFRTLCINAPRAYVPQLAGPKANPQRVAAELERMRSMLASRKPMQWAYDLQDREGAGEALTPGQKAAMRDTLRDGMDTTITGDFTPVPEHCLPPGMRGAEA